MISTLQQPSSTIEVVDPELERLLQDLKRARSSVSALEERLLRYVISRSR